MMDCKGNVNTPASSRVIGSPLNDRAHHNGSEGRTQDYGYVTKQPWYSGASDSLGRMTPCSATVTGLHHRNFRSKVKTENDSDII